MQAFKGTSDPDTMYLHEAMEDPYFKDFIVAMVKKLKYHKNNGKHSIIPNSQVPTGATILTAVYKIKGKLEIKTRAIKKWKARLNIDWSRTKKGIHYEQTYALVVSWNSI